jgi:hypothetical protein
MIFVVLLYLHCDVMWLISDQLIRIPLGHLSVVMNATAINFVLLLMWVYVYYCQFSELLFATKVFCPKIMRCTNLKFLYIPCTHFPLVCLVRQPSIPNSHFFNMSFTCYVTNSAKIEMKIFVNDYKKAAGHICAKKWLLFLDLWKKVSGALHIYKNFWLMHEWKITLELK